MENENYFDKLKRIHTDDIHEAKEHFFLNHWVFAKSRSKMANQLSAKNIPFTYTNSDKTEVHFWLPNIEVTCSDYIYRVVIYNSHGEADVDLTFRLYTQIELSSLLAYDALIPQLWSEWSDIEPQVLHVCEQNFKNNWGIFVMEIANSSSPDAKRIRSEAFKKMLKHKIQQWPKERRLQSAILSDFANEGFPFNSGHKTGYYFREFGEMKITYKLKAFTAFIDYKGVNATLDCKLTAESIRALETLMPPLYELACNATEEGLKQLRLRSINKKAMDNLLEAKMKELSLEYALFQWYGNDESCRSGKAAGIELKIKCKNRRCLTFHVRYEKMEQFLKIINELPKTIETINSLPFNALVSIYGNNVKWKKGE